MRLLVIIFLFSVSGCSTTSSTSTYTLSDLQRESAGKIMLCETRGNLKTCGYASPDHVRSLIPDAYRYGYYF